MASLDVGIDLGTANILIYVRGRGVVLREPAVIAYDKESEKIVEMGEEARLMLGRTPGNLVAIRPLKHGVISDYTKTEKMLKKASICREGDIIYFIGGKHFGELDIPSASEAYTHIERFDLSRNVWLTSKDIILHDGNTNFPINLKTENKAQ